jgi:F0F1-type ATP synthase membrane subunit a
MNHRQKILIFRTCLAVLVVLKKLAYEQIKNESVNRKTQENLEILIKLITDEVNDLYKNE